MPRYTVAMVVVVVAVAVVIWGAIKQRGRDKALTAALGRAGFQPCPDRKAWLEETLNRLDLIQDHPYVAQDPRKLPGNVEVYYYLKFRPLPRGQSASPQEEILLPVKRSNPGRLVLTLKPSSVKPGAAETIMNALLTGSWAGLPEGMAKIEIPPDLKDSNIMSIIGPAATQLYDLIDPQTLKVAAGLGDVGVTFVHFRESWCTLTGLEMQVPFQVDELVGRIRPWLPS